ncbi:MAG: acyl-CoA dehydrogenase family protein [Actinomycetota bacterium]|nr:acyl-CoA dehydrogenase family protein [Actinomycetota bacterium]
MKSTVSEELKMLDEMARDFAVKELVDDREENDRFPFGPLFDHVLVKAQEVGFYGVLLPEEMGGSAEPVSALCLVLEEVCRADASLGGTVFTNALAQEIVSLAGGENLLGEIVSGDGSFKETLLAFPSFNNPGEVENAARAADKDGGYQLSGTVEYVVLGGLASRALLPARVEGVEGYSFFLVDLGEAGIEVSEPVLSLGMHACPAVDMTLEVVPGRLLGKEGEGDRCFEGAVDRLSVAAAAMAAGVMKGSFLDALEYGKQREQGGRHIVDWSGLRMVLAEMVIKAKVADMLVEKAAYAVDHEEPGWKLASRSAAIQVQELAVDVTTDGIQALGGYGYMKDYGQEKRFRDAKQVQSLMGITPLRRLKFIERVIGGEIPW